MKKNSNRSYKEKERNLYTFAQISGRSARKKKMIKDQKNEAARSN